MTITQLFWFPLRSEAEVVPQAKKKRKKVVKRVQVLLNHVKSCQIMSIQIDRSTISFEREDILFETARCRCARDPWWTLTFEWDRPM